MQGKAVATTFIISIKEIIHIRLLAAIDGPLLIYILLRQLRQPLIRRRNKYLLTSVGQKAEGVSFADELYRRHIQKVLKFP